MKDSIFYTPSTSEWHRCYYCHRLIEKGSIMILVMFPNHVDCYHKGCIEKYSYDFEAIAQRLLEGVWNEVEFKMGLNA